MGNKVGTLIKEARTAAKLSQTKLAELAGISASDLSKAEKGEKELSQAVLKKIASNTNITQKSLLDAAKAEADTGINGKVSGILSDVLSDVIPGSKKAAAKKTTKKADTAKKTATAKKTETKKTAAASAKKTETKKAAPAKKTETKKTAPASAKKTETKKTATAKKTTAAKKTTGTKMELTAAEKKLIELYRAADSETKKSAVSTLKGESGGGIVGDLLSGLLKG